MDVKWTGASPFWGSQITWYFCHEDKVLVWRGGEELIHHAEVVIEDDVKVPQRILFEEVLVIEPTNNGKVVLGDAVSRAGQYWGLKGMVSLIVDSKQPDHIVVTLEAQ